MPKFNVYLTARFVTAKIASAMDIEAADEGTAFEMAVALDQQGKLIWTDESQEYDGLHAEVETHGETIRTSYGD